MTADLQPTLVGERLLLRPLRSEDFGALYAVARDPEIWALHPAHDRWREDVFRRFFDKALASGGALVVLERDTGRVIGSSRYYHEFDGPGEIVLGFTFLARDHWGGATNRELKRLMIGHALSFAHTALFSVGETNLRSRRAMEKIGGRLTERTLDTADQGRHIVYAITPEDFAAGPLMREGAGGR